MSEIIVYAAQHPFRDLILVGEDHKDSATRLRQFVIWQEQEGQRWHDPDLAGWRDHLLARGMVASSVQAYLSTIRAAYRRIVKDNDVRTDLYRMTPTDLLPGDRKAIVDEMLTRISNAIDPDTAPVSVTKKQDRAESEGLRLTSDQAEYLLNAPNLKTPAGLRDAAMIAIMLCTGIREDELCSIQTDDLRQKLGTALALRVTRGKGNKQRLIPYGVLDWCVSYADDWMTYAGIRSGYVFRGLNRWGHARQDRLTTRAVQMIIGSYPIYIDGEPVIVRPHDLRRTYARLQYYAGMELVAIQQNLGHAKIETTLGYIGELDDVARRGKAIIRPGRKPQQGNLL